MFYLKPEHLKTKSAKEQARGLDSDVSDWESFYRQQAEESNLPLLTDYYAGGLPDPSTSIGEVELLSMDMETTGFDAEKDGIVSLSIVPFTLNRIRLNSARQWLLKPKYALTDSSILIHRLTHSDIDSGQEITEIFPELLAQMRGKIVVVHFRAIERPFLDATLRDRLGEGIHFPVIDTMDLEARLHRNQKFQWSSLWKSSPPVSIRLADSRRRYHLPDYRPHHATTDAIACAELLQAQISHRYSANTPLSEFIL